MLHWPVDRVLGFYDQDSPGSPRLLGMVLGLMGFGLIKSLMTTDKVHYQEGEG